MKKFLLLFLVLICIIPLASCKNAEPEARKALSNFLVALTDLDGEKMTQYVVNGEALPQEIREFSDTKLIEKLPVELGGYRGLAESIVREALDGIKAESSFKIKGYSKKGGKYVYEVDIIVPHKISGLDVVIKDLAADKEIKRMVLSMIKNGAIDKEKVEEIKRKLFEKTEIEKTSKEVEITMVRRGDGWKVSYGESQSLADIALGYFGLITKGIEG